MFQKTASDGAARTGILHLAHGKVHTPVFMPVGTQASVKTLTSGDIRDIGFEIILANTYHLLLRPGPDLVADAGGLHGFSSFSGNFLTDSGGFQVFSLAKLRKILPDGVRFRSHIDGNLIFLTPEISIETQLKLGSDILMVMDECLAYPSDIPTTAKSLDLTMKWEKRSKEYFLKRPNLSDQKKLFGIVQGGFDHNLRREAAKRTVELGFDGYAIGGLSVGEPYPLMHELLKTAVPELPEDSPRYLMGLGSPLEIARSVADGIDMFDCVLPTRIGRHGTLYTSQGKLKIKNTVYREDFGPLDPCCSCFVCKEYSRAYLRHLFISGEFLAMRLFSFHNLYYMHSLMKKIRLSIQEKTLSHLISELEQIYD